MSCTQEPLPGPVVLPQVHAGQAWVRDRDCCLDGHMQEFTLHAGMSLLHPRKEHPSAHCSVFCVIEWSVGGEKCNSIVVPDNEKQAWLCHTREVQFYLSKSGQGAPVIFL